MKHVMLRDLEVSRIGLGAMGMSFGYTGAGADDAESIRTIHRAVTRSGRVASSPRRRRAGSQGSPGRVGTSRTSTPARMITEATSSGNEVRIW